MPDERGDVARLFHEDRKLPPVSEPRRAALEEDIVEKRAAAAASAEADTEDNPPQLLRTPEVEIGRAHV